MGADNDFFWALGAGATDIAQFALVTKMEAFPGPWVDRLYGIVTALRRAPLPRPILDGPAPMLAGRTVGVDILVSILSFVEFPGVLQLSRVARVWASSMPRVSTTVTPPMRMGSLVSHLRWFRALGASNSGAEAFRFGIQRCGKGTFAALVESLPRLRAIQLPFEYHKMSRDAAACEFAAAVAPQQIEQLDVPYNYSYVGPMAIGRERFASLRVLSIRMHSQTCYRPVSVTLEIRRLLVQSPVCHLRHLNLTDQRHELGLFRDADIASIIESQTDLRSLVLAYNTTLPEPLTAKAIRGHPRLSSLMLIRDWELAGSWELLEDIAGSKRLGLVVVGGRHVHFRVGIALERGGFVYKEGPSRHYGVHRLHRFWRHGMDVEVGLSLGATFVGL